MSLGQIEKLTDYTKGHLSKIENGLRPASPRLVRVYESLLSRPTELPPPQPSRPVSSQRPPLPASYGGEILRARTTLGLSQRDLAALVGVSLGYVSKLENGQSFGSPYVARLLDKRLRQDGALLNLFSAASTCGPDPVRIPRPTILAKAVPARPSEAVEAAVAGAAAELERLRVHRHRFGPAAVVSHVVTQIVALHGAAAAVSVRQAPTFRYVEARYAEYLSWLAEELADAGAMREWLMVAVQLGADYGDSAVAGYAAIRRASTALRANDPETALGHVQAVLSDPELPSKLRRIALQRESRARARIGDREGFSRVMDAFYDLVGDTPAPPAQNWEWGPSWDPQLGSSRLTEATGLMELEEFRMAAEVFATTMPRTFPDGHESNPSLRHARVCFAIREATAYAHVHECDRAADVIESFLPAVPSESVTVRHDLRRLASILSRRRAARLRSLTPDIITLARTAHPRIRGKRPEAPNA
ncbi:transcriptional regulator with XRE-family HTH domain [Catenulispora sp. GAS73]